MYEIPISVAMNAKLIGCGEQTVVLSHGYGANQSIWDNILPILAQTYRVLLFDWSFSSTIQHPQLFDSFNNSSFTAFADDLISLSDEMNLKNTVFIGHSMAGMIGCIASVKRPDIFTQLILIGSSPRYLNEKNYEGGFNKDEVDNILSNIESNFETWAINFATLTVGANNPNSVEKFGKNLQRMRPEVALSVARIVFLSDQRDVLEKVELPCTIIQCSNDIVVPNSVANFMQSKIKGKTSIEIIETDGHFPQLTAHEMLIKVLQRVIISSPKEIN
ncbi:putative hydrolase/acyltransferase (alpha/beta hydrolase superfamily) protein [Dioscorea alata]|uniref:Hydrolase/acyltransferase (Alpha/beta hydrolase superfamily) protein n=1 Tax=Dioscorea alata TaxID=55571 RepID=A0ACB7UAG7_DIOAL|nr:putative hydrolase/acyltransferase (alpha/beta hydrolase superfamily) protein [Dioscorea alata]